MSRIRQVAYLTSDDNAYDYHDSFDHTDSAALQNCSSEVLLSVDHAVSRRVNVSQSPLPHAFYCHHPIRLTIDTDAETYTMRASLAKQIGTNITKSSPLAVQANGRTPLYVIGETRLSLTHRRTLLTLEALVVEDLDVDILARTPFMTTNDIAVRPAKLENIIAGTDEASYEYSEPPQNHHAVRACHLLRAPNVLT